RLHDRDLHAARLQVHRERQPHGAGARHQHVGVDVGQAHCAMRMLAVRITLAHFSVSDRMYASKASGLVGAGSTPRLRMLAFMCSSLSAAVISALSRLTIACGVPAGATTPNQPVES